MSYTIEQIAEALGVPAVGNVGIRIERIAEPVEAGADALALAMDPEYSEKLQEGKARAAVLLEGDDWRAFGLEAAILVPRPRYAMARLTKLMDAGPDIEPGIHATVVVDPTSKIGTGAAIGPLVVIGKRAMIGRNARIASHSVIAADVQIGDEALILEGVKIGARTKIGDRFTAHPGAVIGADGFSFVTPAKSTMEGVRESMGREYEARAQGWERIHSLGSVRIGDDVEIGANTTIDRSTVRDTTIGSGTKIDNLVQIGHNVEIGSDCLLCGHSGVAGSSILGDRVVVGGAASIADYVRVGDDAVVAGKSGVASNVPAGRAVMGYPAMPLDRNVESYKALRRLPRLFKIVEELQNSIRLIQGRS